MKPKKPERKLQRKVSADSDSSLDLPLNQKILPRASAVLAPKVTGAKTENPAPAPAATTAATPSPAPEDDGGSIFLKSLSALRDNCLSPAEAESNMKEGRLLGALGISENAS